MDDIAVEEEEELERHATHGLGSTENVDDAVEDQVVEQCVIDKTVENDDVIDDQEVLEQDTSYPMDDIAVEEEDKLEQHTTHGLGSTENVDDAVEDQEVVGQCVIDRKDESTDGTAVDDQEKAVEQCAAYGWGTTENDDAKDYQEVVSATANGRDGDIWKEKVKLPYPQRPGKLNCPFYMSTGSCSYGFSCNFHHPPLKTKPGGSWRSSEQGNQGVAEILELNRIGFPIREGSRNCTYYMRNGACRYGKHCHFNHPEHVIDAQFYAPTGWEDSALQLEKSLDHHTTVDDTSHLKKSSDDATLDDTSYSKKFSDHATLNDTSSSTGVLPPNILRMLLPPQKVPATTEAKMIPVKKDSNWSSTSDDSDGCCSADSSDGPLCKQEHVDSSDGSLCKQEHVDYPERPGRPECPFYMRFGDCKFASRCKYHHSIDKHPTRYHPEIPSLGVKKTEYPERPGEPECPFYMKAQFCKFGAQCRFNHPKDSNPTLQIPMNEKKSVATNEHHQPTRITLEDHMPQQQQYPERPGQPNCRYYLQFGQCKFLSACIFHHPRDVLPSGPSHSDQIGPEIHDMPECPFYMKSGKCQFGSACEFRHPKDICSTTEGAFGHRTGSAYDNFTRPENVVQQREQTKYPERPGEPECFQYMKHGSCRLQMNCRYHHPADQLSRKQYDSTYH
uniref:Uncharacterized protein n=1 Tax=Avena sativa TaxID=4498 RepID=A0ACD5VNW0_AVESA